MKLELQYVQNFSLNKKILKIYVWELSISMDAYIVKRCSKAAQRPCGLWNVWEKITLAQNRKDRWHWHNEFEVYEAVA